MTDVEVREATDADEPAVLALLAAAMGRPADDRFRRLFHWKHRANPFGVSPAWVAVADGAVAGYRTWLRWEFTDRSATQRAVRAVDTATHPDHQGKGIFRTLTLHALEQARAEGVAYVFNTPNDNSRPGYLKMGWEPVGTLRPMVRPGGLTKLPAILRGRVPASHWGEPTQVGHRPDELFRDDTEVAGLLAAADVQDGRLRTVRSPAYLRWRYDTDLLGYRALPLTDRLADGVGCFRLRRRGPALEATIGDLVAPPGAGTARRLISAVLRATEADYALVLGQPWRAGLLPVPGQGPTLVWRELQGGAAPGLDRWALSMGDIELF